MLTNGLVNGQSTGYAGRLNYISIYPSWNEGLQAAATNEVWVSGLVADTNDWVTASNNTVDIQSAIDNLAASGGIVHIPTGRFYLASREITDESKDETHNSAVFIYRSNVQIQGAGKTDTTLVAHNRAATIFYVGRKFIPPDETQVFAVTNITFTGLTLEGSPHWKYDPGQPNQRRWEESAFPGYQNVGCLMLARGKSASEPLENLLVTNCLFRNASYDAIILPANLRKFLARHSDFVFWDGPNEEFGGTGQGHDVGIWVKADNLSFNLNVIECTYNGNTALTNITTSGGFGDGILWCQWNGGNWFAARNAITNYDLEGIQWSCGPAAAVQNMFFTWKSSFATCALNNPVFAGSTGPSGRSIDRSFAFVGNEVIGGWHGILGCASSPANYVPVNALLVCGNTFALHAPPPTSNPSAAVRCWLVDTLNVSGNTLLGGGMGMDVWPGTAICTNAVLLCNDFSSATNSSIRDIGLSGDLLSAAIVKNKLSSGVKTTTAHLESATVEDGPHYFLLYNQYVNGDGQPNTLLLSPVNLPVHVVQP